MVWSTVIAVFSSVFATRFTTIQHRHHEEHTTVRLANVWCPKVPRDWTCESRWQYRTRPPKYGQPVRGQSTQLLKAAPYTAKNSQPVRGVCIQSGVSSWGITPFLAGPWGRKQRRWCTGIGALLLLWWTVECAFMRGCVAAHRLYCLVKWNIYIVSSTLHVPRWLPLCTEMTTTTHSGYRVIIYLALGWVFYGGDGKVGSVGKI